ncbi:MAG: glutamate synthase large subunit [Pseudomonadota bacterium]|nr:glutamate synthase large subunit [Pseudomonadota bacterium]
MNNDSNYLAPKTAKTGSNSSKGLYDPSFEHDSCGIGFLANLDGKSERKIVEHALTISERLEHRGGCGCEDNTGDGAGLLIQMPDEFFRTILNEQEIQLPKAGQYGSGMVFLSQNSDQRKKQKSLIESICEDENQQVFFWRNVPINDDEIGPTAKNARPFVEQIFIKSCYDVSSQLAFERKLFVIRKLVEQRVSKDASLGQCYFSSLSSRTFCYKGMLLGKQLRGTFPDLNSPEFKSAIALVHQRFSTNTFPSWALAQPFRFVAHNGEINTVRGNRNWMAARESLCDSKDFGEDLKKVFPVISQGNSDSASFDEVLEFLFLTGRPLPLSVLMMIPEAWSGHDSMPDDLKAFYEYHSCLMEPWDGPASLVFTDGQVVGAVLDRNGLRPSRYYVTKDNMVVLASEVGVLDIPPENIKYKERLRPGRIFLVDTVEGRIIEDTELKNKYAGQKPYRQWLNQGIIRLDDLPLNKPTTPEVNRTTLIEKQMIFGYTDEDLKLLMQPMAENGVEATGSMGTDSALAILSKRSRSLFDYFKQLFAQVTNPPIDGIREELVTQTCDLVGPSQNLLQPDKNSCKKIYLDSLVIKNEEFAKLENLNNGGLSSVQIPITYEIEKGTKGLEDAISKICQKANEEANKKNSFIILTDKNASQDLAPIPSALVVSAVHHHLIEKGNRMKTAILIQSGEPREVHHFAVLIGYGADAVNPYLAFDSLEAMLINDSEFSKKIRAQKNNFKLVAPDNYVKAVNKGLVKVMSKMGISSVQSYRGAQIFEAIGLNSELVNKYFKGTPSRIEGIDLETLHQEICMKYLKAFPKRGSTKPRLDSGGEYQWRRDGEYHLFNPETVFKLQHATQQGRYDIFKEYSELVDEQSKNRSTLRGLFKFKPTSPIPIEEVESAHHIMKRFHTGAMSYGSISGEAHETLAVALNRVGGKSNTGEGGEDPARFKPDKNGDLKRSAIKQVASGRFGVTSEYLVNSDDIQIKMAQGAKPGEGGQLPGHKVYPWVAKVRGSTPGVGLISPPPHHDIYSIEDLAQLIHDLKNSNPEARVHVKLVSEVGVGTVAAGVAKAHSDVVLISGYDGGTGASPVTSLKHAGVPWELGLAETQQVLIENNLRDRITVQVDGQMKTARDCIIGAMLGAEEFGFSTAPLVVMGCIMMRVCHLNTCPVGVATQDPELRKKFAGKPEFVENFFQFIAEEMREIMASLGVRSIDKLIGQVEYLDYEPALDHWKAKGLNLSSILKAPPSDYKGARYRTKHQNHKLEKSLDATKILDICKDAIEKKKPVQAELEIKSTNRTVGTILGYEITKKYGGEGLPQDTIRLKFHGSAGQSFGAFVPNGVTMYVEGDANDYVGKGLSGGKIVIYPPKSSTFVAEHNILIGNVVLYGATSGEAYFRGVAGERFAVRNSGASAVVEGVGDHGCEYMTGGEVVILGPTGRNFAAGMSGGLAFVYDPAEQLSNLCNHQMIDVEAVPDEKTENLKNKIESHVRYTNSHIGKKILDHWEESRNYFKLVIPKDYKRVLQAIEKAELEGTPKDEAIMEAAHG